MPETASDPGLLYILVTIMQDVSFWTGLVTVAAFSQGRFNEKQLDHEELDPPLPARSFTSRFRYYNAAAFYTGAYVALYCALVTLGAVPRLQGVLKELFGVVEAVGTGADIGTPAWAAMMLMVMAPTVPWVRRAELVFRLWLQEFSDIPFKAREISDDILGSLAASRGIGGGVEQATNAELAAVFAGVRGARMHLVDGGRPRRNHQYLNAFRPYEDLLRRTERRFSSIANGADGMRSEERYRAAADDEEEAEGVVRHEPAAHSATPELLALARRYARLVACVLLQVEAEEFYARRRLRQIPDLGDVRPADFRFRRRQVVVGVIVVVALACLTGPLVSLYVNAGVVLRPEEVWAMVAYWFWWGVVASVAFVLPLTFAAAVHMYLVDRRYFRGANGTGGAGVAGTLLMGFLGCYGLALLPIAAVEAWRATANGVSFGLFQAMLWALPPAVVSLLYNWLSYRSPALGRAASVALHFAVFALVAGLVTGLIVSVITLQVLSDMKADDFSLFPDLVRGQMGVIVTVTVVAGFFGAVQCALSRQTTTTAQARAQERSPIALVPQHG